MKSEESGTGVPPVTEIKKRRGACLPHWTRDGGWYSVTFRLWDSLPQPVIESWLFERENIVKTARQMKRSLSEHEERRLADLYSEKVERYLDAGYGSCYLKDDRVAKVVRDAAHSNSQLTTFRFNLLVMILTRTALLLLSTIILPVATLAQSSEFNQPWKDPNVALAIDPYERNDIDWEQLATDKRVVAIIHRATIGFRADAKYAERKIEAKKRGYKWGAYHYGKPGDAIKQADFFLATVKPEADDLLALDLESTDSAKHMSLEEARIFINRIKEKTGRLPTVYANNEVTKAIADQYAEDDLFAQTPLWYARYRKSVNDFPAGPWKTYTLWQFSCEMNCKAADRGACLYTVPGTEYDMDVNVFNGTVTELKRAWPLDVGATRKSALDHLQ